MRGEGDVVALAAMLHLSALLNMAAQDNEQTGESKVATLPTLGEHPIDREYDPGA